MKEETIPAHAGALFQSGLGLKTFNFSRFLFLPIGTSPSGQVLERQNFKLGWSIGLTLPK